MNKLLPYAPKILQFNLAHYHDITPFTPQDIYEEIVQGIKERWAGGAAAFNKGELIGFLNFVQINNQLFEAGFAYVVREFTRKGVWTQLSRLIEAEAKNMGAKEMRRIISEDVGFLARHLIEANRYISENENPSVWNNKPLLKRL